MQVLGHYSVHSWRTSVQALGHYSVHSRSMSVQVLLSVVL